VSRGEFSLPARAWEFLAFVLCQVTVIPVVVAVSKTLENIGKNPHVTDPAPDALQDEHGT
jgi:hypothetical protein